MITLEVAQQHLNAWLEADLKIAQMESYSFSTPSGQQTVSRSNPQNVRDNIRYWQNQVNALSAHQRQRYSLGDFSQGTK